METVSKKGRKYLILWAAFCLLVTALGVLLPVKQMRSLGLAGANQANLRTSTGELRDGSLLEFTMELPSEEAEQIGFFFTVNHHTDLEGQLSLRAIQGEHTVGEQQYALEELTEDQFLFVPLALTSGDGERSKDLTVQIFTDAKDRAFRVA